ncbi:MAG: 3-oxoadipate enol-lactonase [bacterium]
MRVTANGIGIEYEIDGPSGAPVVTFSHALATHLGIWEPQTAALAGRYRVLRYDTRGHGGSDVPAGSCSFPQLVEDIRALLDHVGVERTHFVGISMGGMIGQWLALTYPERLLSLVLCDTSARTPPEAGEMWDERVAVASREGMAAHVEPSIGRWFTPGFVRKHPEVVDPVRAMIGATDPRGFIGCAAALRAHDVLDRLSGIKVPTLIIVGEEDPGTPVAAAEAIHERIAGSELVVLDSASHLSNLERGEAFNQELLAFLSRVGMDEE